VTGHTADLVIVGGTGAGIACGRWFGGALEASQVGDDGFGFAGAEGLSGEMGVREIIAKIVGTQSIADAREPGRRFSELAPRMAGEAVELGDEDLTAYRRLIYMC
jgi:hypothetical protein